MTRVVMLSAVRHARQYLPILQRFADVDLVGVAEPGDEWARERSEATARQFGVPMVGLDEALAAADVAVVCSEVTRHAELAGVAVAAGLAVIVDKPPALGAAQLSDLLSGDRNGTPRVTAVHRLFAPAVVQGRRFIDDGGIGLPLAVDCQWISYGGMDDPMVVEAPELVCDPALSGGGEFTNFGWYAIVAILYLTGLHVVSTSAFGGAFFHDAHRTHDTDDAVVASLELTRQVPATLTVARLPYPGRSSATFTVIGSHGDCAVDEDLFAAVNGVEDVTPATGTVDTVELFFRDALDCFSRGTEPVMSAELMWHAVSVLEAVNESLRSGHPVAVALTHGGR